MICEHCHKENRNIAKFCRWCGKPLSSNNILGRLIGLEEVKKQMKTVVDTYAFLHSRKDVVNVRLSINAVIMGETGTGKTQLSEIFRDYFYQHRIISKPKLTVVDAVDYQRFVDKWDDNVKNSKGGILFFDNVQKLLPDRYCRFPESESSLPCRKSVRKNHILSRCVRKKQTPDPLQNEWLRHSPDLNVPALS